MMRAKLRPVRRTVDLVGDLALLAWLVVWAFVAKFIADLVASLANPALATADKTNSLAKRIDEAGTDVASAPVVGEFLAKPFGSVAEALRGLATGANEQAELVLSVAGVLFWVFWAIPVLAIAWNYLPWRITRAREAIAARAFINEQADLDLFALRAMSNAPMTKIAMITGDPVAAWRDGDRTIINALADLELRRVGIGVIADS